MPMLIKNIATTSLAALALVISTSCTPIARMAGWQKTESIIPAAKVVKAPVEMKIHTIGELRPEKTAMIVAPPVAGGTLQIVQIVETGTRVKEGDIVVAFDPSEQEYNLEQSRSQLEEAEQQIKKMKADQAVRAAQERVTLLRAQYEVQRAELKVKGNEVLSGIEARKNVIAMEEAKRKLQQLQRDIQSRASSDTADLMVQNVSLARATMSMKMAQQFIDNMICRSPVNGIVVLGQNLDSLMSASGSISISSETEIPRFRQGDQAYPGRLIAQIQSVDSMEIAAKVIETDRSNMKPGQTVEVRMDSSPLKIYKGKLKSLSESAISSGNEGSTIDYLEALSTRSFAALFEVDVNGDPLNMGVTAQITIPGKDAAAVLSLPRQAIHQKEGKSIVYVRNPKGWQSREVRIKYFTESRAILEGLAEGTEVSLVDPERQKGKSADKSGPLTSLFGATKQ
jgi:HlyD family secretion protein